MRTIILAPTPGWFLNAHRTKRAIIRLRMLGWVGGETSKPPEPA